MPRSALMAWFQSMFEERLVPQQRCQNTLQVEPLYQTIFFQEHWTKSSCSLTLNSSLDKVFFGAPNHFSDFFSHKAEELTFLSGTFDQDDSGVQPVRGRFSKK